MSDVWELITRCRKGRNAEPVLMLGGKAHDPRCLEAADALAAQAAEIERLQAQVQSAALDYLALDGQASEALAEAERLREALRSIDGMVQEATRAPLTADRWVDRIEECARAALGQKP